MTHQTVKCSLCCCFVVSLRQSLSFPLFLIPNRHMFLMKHVWKTEVCIFCCPLSPVHFIQNEYSSRKERLLPLGCLTFILLLVQVLEKGLHCHRLGLQVHDLQQHINLMFKLTALQDQENKRVQKWVSETKIIFRIVIIRMVALFSKVFLQYHMLIEFQDVEHPVASV